MSGGNTGVCPHTGAALIEFHGAPSTVMGTGAKYSSRWRFGPVAGAFPSPLGFNWMGGGNPYLSQCTPGEIAVVFDLFKAYWFSATDSGYSPMDGAN